MPPIMNPDRDTHGDESDIGLVQFLLAVADVTGQLVQCRRGSADQKLVADLQLEIGAPGQVDSGPGHLGQIGLVAPRQVQFLQGV